MHAYIQLSESFGTYLGFSVGKAHYGVDFVFTDDLPKVWRRVVLLKEIGSVEARYQCRPNARCVTYRQGPEEVVLVNLPPLCCAGRYEPHVNMTGIVR